MRDLPTAVGPISRMQGVILSETKPIAETTLANSRCNARPRPRVSSLTLPSPQEEAVEIGERQLKPRQSPVIALARALGRFHLAQQPVHLRDRQGSMRAH